MDKDILRLVIQSATCSISVEQGAATRAVSAAATVPDGMIVHGATFFGPVHVVISDRTIDPPFQHGSLSYDVDMFGNAFASLWLVAPAETVDRIADNAGAIHQVNAVVSGVLVNGGEWHQPETPAAVRGFTCSFGPGH
ncbi:hypothetical protein Xcc3_43890 [Xanthomonas campestris pv. campestris]|nr:hypothetical protein ASJ34_11030 [Xanthomonas campestris pv. campestris]BBK03082.1 hypothetical protein Xcc3_43890 [Xanthomonas campestris pv. campestris]